MLAAIFLAYTPVWWAGFIWDDSMFVAGNGTLSLRELVDIWTTRAADICPLTLTLFRFLYVLFGSDPLPYHLANVLLHAAAALVLWRVLLALKIPGAWIGAALWALHPVNVESVAWIAETKNTLCGVFFMLSALFYIEMLRLNAVVPSRGRHWRLYGFALLFGAMAMASKTSAIPLPFVLGLCAWWVEGRWHWRRGLELLPLAAISALAIALTLWTIDPQRIHVDPHLVRSWPERIAASGDVFWFYLGKLAWPHPLILVYPQWTIDAGRFVSYLPLLGAMGLFAVLWIKCRTWGRPYFFAVAYYLALIFPVLGLVDHAFVHLALVADHLQYLAGIGPLALIGAGIARLSAAMPLRMAYGRRVVPVVLLAALAVVTWNRAWAFESGTTIWTDTLAKNQNCWIGYGNLGVYQAQAGDGAAAIADFQKAVALNPFYEEAYCNLGVMLMRQGKNAEAVAAEMHALEIHPDFAQARYNLGQALVSEGKLAEAIVQFKKALELDPNYQAARESLDSAEMSQQKKGIHE